MNLRDRLAAAASLDELAVLADELSQAGNVVGTALGLSPLSAPSPFSAFATEHDVALLGELLASWVMRGAALVSWKHGLVDVLDLAPWPRAERAELGRLGEVFEAPLLARLRVLRATALETNGSMDPLSKTMPGLPHLESLVVGWNHLPFADEHQISWLWLGDVGRAVTQHPSPKSLSCRGSAPNFEGLRAPNLERLRVESSTLAPEALTAIGEAPLPRLTTLELGVGDGEYGPCATIDDCAALIELAPRRFPGLRHFGLRNTPFTNELVPLLAKSDLLRQLESVNLSLGVLDGVGATELVKHRAAFARLACLELGDNVLDLSERARLAATLPMVRFAEDRPWRKQLKNARYVSISE